MKFMMFVCTDTEPDTAPDGGETTLEAWSAKNDAAGVRLAGDRLRPPADATVVRKRGGHGAGDRRSLRRDTGVDRRGRHPRVC